MNIVSKFLFGVLALMLLSSCSNQEESSSTISFATNAAYPPFEYVSPGGKIEGFDIDIANAICARINRKCSFENQQWEGLIPGLKFQKYDAVISSMGITEQRLKVVSFTEPYYYPYSSFVAAKGALNSLAKNDIQGKTVGVLAGSTLGNYLKATYGDSVNIKTYPNQENAFLDLQAGRVDAVFSDTPVIMAWIKKADKDKFAVIGEPIYDAKLFGEGLGIAVGKQETALLKELNKGLKAVKVDGTLEKIYQKYNLPYKLSKPQ